MDAREQLAQASVKTATDLRTIARTSAIANLSRLSLPEIDAVIDAVARVIPAGNVPGVILNGLTRLPDRRLPLKTMQRDINLLFKGIEQVLDQAVYSAFFAGPAAVIWGYQNLLKLAGKDIDESFPEGIWQFYVDYALREDTARHTNETHGFDTTLKQHHIQLSLTDRLTAWVMTAIHCLHQYNALLENEWRERVYTHLLAQVTASLPDAARYASVYRDWQKQLPYSRSPDSRETYPTYRKACLDRFLQPLLDSLPDSVRQKWLSTIHRAKTQELPAYQRQMSILAYLEPGTYGETRIPISLEQAHIGLIYRRHYYLIPACQPDARPLDAAVVRAQIAAILARPAEMPAEGLEPLARARRAALTKLRGQLDRETAQELGRLRLCPILINADLRPRHLPLADLRQGERGIGDHALTIFSTGETMVFDQSHIFFDGTWGAALAEILTNEALSWAAYLHSLPPIQPGPTRPYRLRLSFPNPDPIHQLPRVPAEVSDETDAVNLSAVIMLRKLFKQRSDLLRLTVNDLLVLYRAVHAATYQPAPDLLAALEALSRDTSAQEAALSALNAIARSKTVNPAILIPVDASAQSPRDRLYPMTFQVPLLDLDLLNLHEQTVRALDAYKTAAGDRSTLYTEFDRLQRTYLAALAGFGEVLSKAKDIALRGESASIGSIKLLAHIPPPLQHMLDQIPSRLDMLNDVVKGREVFSNVGAVAPSSTLTRFITAKDDNEQKTLAWGVITDAQNVMRISLRDFRPHVGLLDACGRRDMAIWITRDYLRAFAQGLNHFIRDLLHITRASRETDAPK